MTHPLLSDAVAYAALVAFNMETPRTGLPNMDAAQAAMKAALKALTAAGYVVVPREPTQAMLMAAAMDDAYDFGWEAMLAAAEVE